MTEIIQISGTNRMWWAGDNRVERYMPEIASAIKRHLPRDSQAFTDIYNRAYEAVYSAINDTELNSQLNVVMRPNPAQMNHEKSVMVRYVTTYGPEGERDADAYCPNPECDDNLNSVDSCNYCPTCGQKVHWEPQSEDEAIK